MAKLKAPLLSLGASGKLGGALVYFPWKGIDAVREYVIPANPRSTAQTTQRGYFEDAVDAWHANAYTDADRVAWNRFAGTLAKTMAGFNAFMRSIIAMRIAGDTPSVVSDVQVNSPSPTGFAVDVENSVAGLSLTAQIGTSKTHFPDLMGLMDDGDGTYSAVWVFGTAKTEYYVRLIQNIGGNIYHVTGIYHIKTT